MMGTPKTPVWDANYDPNKMTVSVEAKVNAGTGYTAAFTPDSNHQWWDGTVDAKTATWAIGKGDQVVSVKSDKCDAEYRRPKRQVYRDPKGRRRDLCRFQ